MSIKLTSIRKRILQTIEDSVIPINAREISKTIDEANIASVYRGLQFLQNKGFIHGFSLAQSTGNTNYYYKSGRTEKHFLYCETCHNFSSFEGKILNDKIIELEKEHDYKILDHVLYLMGKCGKCRNKQE